MTTLNPSTAHPPSEAERLFFECRTGYKMDPFGNPWSSDVAALRQHVASQQADKPAGTARVDSEAINGYLACIAQHGNPEMDMANWSDFVNRVQHLQAERDAAQKVNVRLREWIESNKAGQENIALKLGSDPADIGDYSILADTSDIAAFVLVKREEWKKLQADYNDLIYQVARVWPGESRHETAKRYIRQTEEQTAALQPASETKGTT